MNVEGERECVRSGVKREFGELGEVEEGEGETEMEQEGESGRLGTKRVRETRQEAPGEGEREKRSSKLDLNFPLPDETGLPCLLKVSVLYRASIGVCVCVCVCVCVQVYSDGVEALRVTSAVECVGVLSKHPLLTHFEGGHDNDDGDIEMVGESAAERSAHCPPPSLVPRLHCILVTPLSHTNPLLPRDLPHPLPGEGQISLPYHCHSLHVFYMFCAIYSTYTILFVRLMYIVYRSRFGGVVRSRDLVLSLLTSALWGDQLAAEFTLLHLLSSVHGRSDVMALGKFSLNLTRCPPTSAAVAPPPLQQPPSLAPSLHNLISQLLAQVALSCLTKVSLVELH